MGARTAPGPPKISAPARRRRHVGLSRGRPPVAVIGIDFPAHRGGQPCRTGGGLSRGDRNRNKRLDYLRELVPTTHACWDRPGRPQAGRGSDRPRLWGLGAAPGRVPGVAAGPVLDWALEQARSARCPARSGSLIRRPLTSKGRRTSSGSAGLTALRADPTFSASATRKDLLFLDPCRLSLRGLTRRPWGGGTERLHRNRDRARQG